MQIFFLFVDIFARFVAQSIHHVEQSVKKLRESGLEYGTFYEFFGVLPTANRAQISTEFRKRIRKIKSLPNMTKEETEAFITNAYDIITNHRDTYDYFLRYSVYPKPSFSLWYCFFLVAFTIFALDIFVMFYLHFKQQKLSKKQLKKALKRGDIVRKISFSNLYSIRLFKTIKNKIKG